MTHHLIRWQTGILDSAFASANNELMHVFEGIEVFVRVVETGSFTAAAERLQTAKSSVSETVRALEERLGVRLLDRTTRRVRATEAGRAFFSRCQQLMDEAEAARAEVSAQQQEAAGRLRVAVPEAFSSRYLVPAIPGFLAANPSVEIELVESPNFVRLVEDGFDLAIRLIYRPEDEGLVVRRIGVARVALVAAPSYLAQHGTPERPDDLLRHRCVVYTPSQLWREGWRLGGAKLAIRPTLLTNSAESLRAAALSGVGIVGVPEWAVADELDSGRLIRLFADYPLVSGAICAVYPTYRLIAPKVRSFVDHIARELRARGLGPRSTERAKGIENG